MLPIHTLAYCWVPVIAGTNSIVRVIVTSPSATVDTTVPPTVTMPVQTGVGVIAVNDCVGLGTWTDATNPVALDVCSSRPSAVNLIVVSCHWAPAYWRGPGGVVVAV